MPLLTNWYVSQFHMPTFCRRFLYRNSVYVSTNVLSPFSNLTWFRAEPRDSRSIRFGEGARSNAPVGLLSSKPLKTPRVIPEKQKIMWIVKEITITQNICNLFRELFSFRNNGVYSKQALNILRKLCVLPKEIFFCPVKSLRFSLPTVILLSV